MTRRAAAGSKAVRVERLHSDLALAGVASFTGFAAGSALGVPWELATPPSDDTPLEMSGRDSEFLAAEWGADVQLAICVAEVAVAGSLETPVALDVLAQRILAWYQSSPVQVPLEVQNVCQWTLDPRLAPSHLVADLVRAGCGRVGSSDPVDTSLHEATLAGLHAGGAGNAAFDSRVSSAAASEKKPASAGAAMRAVARTRNETRRLSARVPGNELLALMVPVALANVGDPVACSRVALAVTSLLSADPRVAAMDIAYAQMLRATLEASAKGTNWRAAIDWAHAVDTTVEHAEYALGGWSPIDGEASIFGEDGLLPDDEAALRSIRDAEDGADAGFSATGAGLDAASAIDRVLAAIDATRWELDRNPELNPVRVAVESAVRAGGDTDTVAALTGALIAGALGPTAVPLEWAEHVWGWPGLRHDGLRDLATGCIYAGIAQERLLDAGEPREDEPREDEPKEREPQE